MNFGSIIVMAVLAVILFFSGRSVVRNIRAEIRGESACAGCGGACGKSQGSLRRGARGNSCGSPQGGACSLCSLSVEDIKRKQ